MSAASRRRATSPCVQSPAARSRRWPTDPDGHVLTQAQLRRFWRCDRRRSERADQEVRAPSSMAWRISSSPRASCSTSRRRWSSRRTRPPSTTCSPTGPASPSSSRRRMLSAYVRIGAMNQLDRRRRLGEHRVHQEARTAAAHEARGRRRQPRPLALLQGREVREPARTSGSSRVREWVQAELPRVEGSTGRPRGMTIAAGATFLKTGVKIATHEGSARASSRA